MVSVAEGLRMMQGGVDRTGFADMADALGNPGLDLIRERRAAAAEAAAMDGRPESSATPKQMEEATEQIIKLKS